MEAPEKPRKKREKKPPRQVEHLAYSVEEALNTGAYPNKTKLYQGIARGEVVSWLEGKLRRISAESLRERVRKREEEARKESAA